MPTQINLLVTKLYCIYSMTADRTSQTKYYLLLNGATMENSLKVYDKGSISQRTRTLFFFPTSALSRSSGINRMFIFVEMRVLLVASLNEQPVHQQNAALETFACAQNNVCIKQGLHHHPAHRQDHRDVHSE